MHLKHKIRHLAILNVIFCDITNYCNCKCKFCINPDTEFTHKKIDTSEETFLNMLSMLKYIDNRGFYLSCVWEPLLHKNFSSLLNLIPHNYKIKLNSLPILSNQLKAVLLTILPKQALIISTCPFNLQMRICAAIYQDTKTRLPIFNQICCQSIKRSHFTSLQQAFHSLQCCFAITWPAFPLWFNIFLKHSTRYELK